MIHDMMIWWYMIYDTRYMICDIWCMIYDIWYDIVPAIFVLQWNVASLRTTMRQPMPAIVFDCSSKIQKPVNSYVWTTQCIVLTYVWTNKQNIAGNQARATNPPIPTRCPHSIVQQLFTIAPLGKDLRGTAHGKATLDPPVFSNGVYPTTQIKWGDGLSIYPSIHLSIYPIVLYYSKLQNYSIQTTSPSANSKIWSKPTWGSVHPQFVIPIRCRGARARPASASMQKVRGATSQPDPGARWARWVRKWGFLRWKIGLILDTHRYYIHIQWDINLW